MKSKDIDKASANYVLNICVDSIYTESTISEAFKRGAYFSNKYWRKFNEWRDISVRMPDEDKPVIFKFTKNVDKTYCRLGYICFDFILLDRGDSMSKEEAIWLGAMYKYII